MPNCTSEKSSKCRPRWVRSAEGPGQYERGWATSKTDFGRTPRTLFVLSPPSSNVWGVRDDLWGVSKQGSFNLSLGLKLYPPSLTREFMGGIWPRSQRFKHFKGQRMSGGRSNLSLWSEVDRPTGKSWIPTLLEKILSHCGTSISKRWCLEWPTDSCYIDQCDRHELKARSRFYIYFSKIFC